MERVLILNGSPRAPRSNSKRYGEIFAACYGENAEICPVTRGNHQELRDKLDGVSHLLFVFPLYADAIPVPLLDFLKFLEDHPPQKRPAVSVLINCGFLEPQQNEIALEMMRLFCRQNRYPFASSLSIGSGEAILNSPFRFLAARKIKRFARSIARGTPQTLSVTMPLTKKWFVAASTSYWVKYGARWGTTQAQMQTMEIQ